MSTSNRVRRTTTEHALIPGSAVAAGTFVTPTDNFKFTSNRQEPKVSGAAQFQSVLFTPKVAKINYKAAGVLSAAGQDTGFDLPAHAVVTDVFLNVNVAEAVGGTKTLDVGTLASESGGDADCFLDGAIVSATGLVQGTVTYNSGSDWPTATTFGVALANFVAGSGTDDRGGFRKKNYLTGSVTAKSVNVSLGSNDFTALDVDIYIVFIELPAPAAE